MNTTTKWNGDQETIDNYVINFYQTNTATEISKLLGCHHSVVSGCLNRLNRLGIVDSSLSYGRVYGYTKGKRLVPKKEYKKREPKVVISDGIFKNHEGVGKQKGREIVSELIGSTSGTHPLILTLPASEWIWEKMILKHKERSEFVGVEKDRKVFNEMVRNSMKDKQLKKSVVGMLNTTMSEVIRKSIPNEYSHSILDYCGTINSFEEEINDLLTRDIVKVNGIISITLSKIGFHIFETGTVTERFLNSVPKEYTKSELSDFTFVTLEIIKNMIYNLKGRYKLDEFYEYCDTSGMMLFIIRRMV